MVEHVMTRIASPLVEEIARRAFPDVEVFRAASSSSSSLPFN
jgi:hypothetical protein